MYTITRNINAFLSIYIHIHIRMNRCNQDTSKGEACYVDYLEGIYPRLS